MKGYEISFNGEPVKIATNFIGFAENISGLELTKEKKGEFSFELPKEDFDFIETAFFGKKYKKICKQITEWINARVREFGERNHIPVNYWQTKGEIRRTRNCIEVFYDGIRICGASLSDNTYIVCLY